MSGDYFEAKRAALAGVPYYDRNWAAGYEQLPRNNVAVHTYLDFSNVDANKRCGKANLPRSSQTYNAQDNGSGFHLWSLDEVAVDIAPKFVNRKLWQLNNLGNMSRVAQKQRGDTISEKPVDPGFYMDTLVWGSGPSITQKAAVDFFA